MKVKTDKDGTTSSELDVNMSEAAAPPVSISTAAVPETRKPLSVSSALFLNCFLDSRLNTLCHSHGTRVW